VVININVISVYFVFFVNLDRPDPIGTQFQPARCCVQQVLVAVVSPTQRCEPETNC
jgi:hypothetical protein